MKDGKGKIYERTLESDKIWTSTTKEEPAVHSKNFCPSCGSEDITIKRVTVFGPTRFIEEATCRNCNASF